MWAFYYHLLLSIICFAPCKTSGGESPYSIKLKGQRPHLIIEGKKQLELREVGNTHILKKLKSVSSNIKVAILTHQDMDHSLDLAPLDQPLSHVTLYSKNVQLIAPFRVMQSFDLDDQGNIYYSQIGAANGFIQGKTKAENLYIIKGKPNQKPSKYMTLKYFGHGGQIAVEVENGNSYIWVSSNASQYSSGEYWDARSVSRIKFESGKVYKGYGGETYFLNNGLYRIEAAIDKENNLICINASKDGTRYFYTYKLSDVEALPVTDFTFSVKIGGEEVGSKEHIVTRTVQGHDLSKLTPLGSFSIPPGKNKTADVNSCHFQGYDIDGHYIYFNEGNGSSSNIPSQAYVTIFDLEGNIVGKRTRVSAISDKEELASAGITNNSGYMEAEGIKIRGNQIYFGYASHQELENYRRANIFKYDSQRK